MIIRLYDKYLLDTEWINFVQNDLLLYNHTTNKILGNDYPEKRKKTQNNKMNFDLQVLTTVNGRTYELKEEIRNE